MTRRGVRFLSALCAVALAASGCTSPADDEKEDDRPQSTAPVVPLDSTSPITDDVSGFVPQAPEWGRCEDRAGYECTTISVPLDWDAVEGPQIDLAVARIQASGKRIGALVTNPGGPGGSGLDYLFGNPFNDEITQRFDIVSWDPRGVGESTAFDCSGDVAEFLSNDPDPDTTEEQDDIDEDAQAVAKDCAASNSDLIGNVGTDSVARDLEAIRIALREPKLTYVGFSYGTLIGLRYLDLFGENSRAMVLDGVVDPTQSFTDWLTEQTKAIDVAVKIAIKACNPDTNCEIEDLGEKYDAVQRRVERRPISGDGDEKLGPAELATAAVFVSYDQSLFTAFADAIEAANRGDGAPMLELSKGYYDLAGFTAYTAVECLDSEHPVGSEDYQKFADELRELSPRIGGSVANELLPCAYWSADPEPITGKVVAPDAPPILVLGNRGDAATPYESSVAVAEMLTTGHLVSFDGFGHTSYGRSECVDAVTNEYLIDLIVPESDPNC